VKITITAGEALGAGKWSHLCELRGLDPCAMRKVVDSDEEFTLTLAEARKMGILAGFCGVCGHELGSESE
jgi:hypothetical protein